TFDAVDGSFILTVGTDLQFRKCCEVIGKRELAADPRFVTNPARVANREALLAILKPIFAQRTVGAWVDAFLTAGIPAGPINDIPAALHDPQLEARSMVQQVTLENGQAVKIVGPAPKLSATPTSIQRPPPMLGQHTEEVLCDVVGLDAATVAHYRQRGVI